MILNKETKQNNLEVFETLNTVLGRFNFASILFCLFLQFSKSTNQTNFLEKIWWLFLGLNYV